MLAGVGALTAGAGCSELTPLAERAPLHGSGPFEWGTLVTIK